MELAHMIRSGNLEQVKAFLSKNPEAISTPLNGFPPLILATYLNQKEIAELLLQMGADINAKDTSGNTALMGVCFKGSKALVEMLIARGADPKIQNGNGETAASFASNAGHHEVVSLLERH